MDRNKLLELAREVFSSPPITHIGTEKLVAFAALIERELRGDAKPALWLTKDGLKTALGEESQTGVKGRVSASAPEDYIALYTHPAPAVVRQLVEALEDSEHYIVLDLARHDEAYDRHPSAERERSQIVQDLEKLRAALAAAKEAGL